MYDALMAAVAALWR